MISEHIDREQVARRIATDSYVEYNHAQNHNGDYERCDLLSRWTICPTLILVTKIAG